jgi:hypothetical protein
MWIVNFAKLPEKKIAKPADTVGLFQNIISNLVHVNHYILNVIVEKKLCLSNHIILVSLR